MPSKKTSETARERELFKYFQPQDLIAQTESPQSSHDASLSAFAQLGALRLKVKRVMISLVSRSSQYVVAEATQTLSLQCDNVHDDDDGLLLGVTTLKRKYGICAHAIDLLLDAESDDSVANAQRDSDGSLSHLVVPDLQSDPRFTGMTHSSKIRFYAATPLRSPAGFIIGMYTISDDKTRAGLSHTESVFLRDIASTVMDHLETTHIKQQHDRAEAMVKGMGLFMEGKDTIRDWWLRTGHQGQSNQMKHLQKPLDMQADEQFGIQDSAKASVRYSDEDTQESVSTNQRKSSGGANTPRHGMRPPPPSNALSTSGKTSLTSDSVLSKIQDKDHSSPATDVTSETGRGSTPSSLHSSTGFPSDSGQQDSRSGAELQQALLSMDVKRVFARASNLIRESTEVDGALYLDASIGTHGRNAAAHIKHVAPDDGSNPSTPWTTSASEEEMSTTDASQDTSPEGFKRGNTTKSSGISKKYCGILGFSTRTRSSLKMHEPAQMHLSVPEAFLQKLLQRYPHGKIFNFDEDGLASSSEDDARHIMNDLFVVPDPNDPSRELSPSRRRSARSLAKEEENRQILQILPGARSIAFFPLWDSHKERWFSGALVWTDSPTRVLELTEDLTYLAAFGNSIMAEVSRLEALVAAQMKHDFISSISHELRSPLHGALAAVEFLQDTDLDLMQADMVNTVDACARTLLDTINHILDFTKMNTQSAIKVKKSRRSKRSPLRNNVTPADLAKAIPLVNLSTLTEEVIQGVYLGYKYQYTPSSQNPSPESNILSKAEEMKIMNEAVVIIVDIEHREDWGFPIDPGAWRRLVMNLFANALKYTEKGFIRVSLNTREGQAKRKGRPETNLILSISDTGQGISKEFLQNHLYTPFVQENTLQPGTGLGLSIVRHIVDDLGGSIEYHSEQGIGTTATISLPFPKVARSSKPPEDRLNTLYTSILPRTSGLVAGLVGFDVYPDIVDAPTGILSTDTERMFSLRSSLIRAMTSWFGMSVSNTVTVQTSPSDVYLLSEQTYAGMNEEEFQIATREDPGSSRKPLILVLSTNVVATTTYLTRGRFSVGFLQQPVGPHKISSVLSRWLREDARDSSNVEAPAKDCSMRRRRTYNRTNSEFSEVTPLAVDTSLTSDSYFKPDASISPSQKQNEPSQNHFTTSNSHSPDSKISRSDSEPQRLPNTLLVDDNQINLKLLVAFMHKLGYPYTTARDGLEALKYYQEPSANFDIVFMDISMPVMDGLACTRAMREFETKNGKKPVTVVALTGAASAAARQEAFRSGIDQYLTKPVPMKTLQKILDELVDGNKRLRKGKRASGGDGG